MQSFATLLFTGDFRNLGLHLPVLELAEMYISFSRLIAFVTALLAMVALYMFLKRTYLGTAIRAISQDREVVVLMGVNPQRVYLVASALGGGLAGIGASLLILQYDVHPMIGISFGPITFMICVLGGLGNMIGGFIAAFVMSQLISLGGFFLETEWGYVIAFVFFIIMMFLRPQGLFGNRS
jgi:branched-chain amino acid transport system permease protein